MSVISMKQLLEAGVHFGHQTRRWNPKMAPYIYTERNGIHIIDLQKTVGKVDEAYNAISDIVADGGTILFVGTKKQAQDAIKTEAERCGMYYVNERWLGGMLTNFKTIQSSYFYNIPNFFNPDFPIHSFNCLIISFTFICQLKYKSMYHCLFSLNYKLPYKSACILRMYC